MTRMRRFLATCGNGQHGRLGHGVACANELFPRIVAALGAGLKQASCGGAHCAVVTDEGALWTFGINNNGQLGHSDDLKEVAVRGLLAGAAWPACSAHSKFSAPPRGLSSDPRTAPVPPRLQEPTEVILPDDMSAVSASESHTLALSSEQACRPFGVARGPGASVPGPPRTARLAACSMRAPRGHPAVP